jgi:hypothetical protein
MRRLFWVLLLVWTSAALGAPPAWIQAALKEDTSNWIRSSSTVALLSSESVEYLAPDRVRRRLRGVTRLTQEAGRDRLVAAVVYNADTDRVRSARAWVIAPDAKDYDVYDKPQFVDAAATYSRYVWDAQRVVAFVPGEKVGPGGTLAWEIEIEATSGIFDCSWVFLPEEPVVRSVFEVTPNRGGKLVWHSTSPQVPEPRPGSSPGSLVWEMHQLAAPPDETPAGFLPNPCRVSVRCLAESAGPDRSWSDLARLVTDVIEPRIVATPEVKALAAKTAGASADRWQRVRAIGEFVQRDVPYLSLTLEKDSLAGYRPHLPADVLQRRLGDCKDKATLVTALLRSLGDNAYLVLVHAQNSRALSPDWPSAFFNHAIVGIPADGATPAHWPTIDGGALGRLVLFDPTDETTPLGVLPPVDQDGYGLVVSASSTGLARLPLIAPDRNARKRVIKATIDVNAGLAAEVSEVALGPVGVAEHRSHADAQADEYRNHLGRRIAQTIPTASAPKWKSHWDPVRCTNSLDLTFTADRYGRWVGRDMMLVCPRLFASYPPLPPWKVPFDGVAWLVPQHLHDEVHLQLPAELAVLEVPKPWTLEQPTLTCSLRYRVEGGELIFESDIVRRTGALSRAEYDQLRGSIQKLDEAERRPLVLRRKPATAASGERTN